MFYSFMNIFKSMPFKNYRCISLDKCGFVKEILGYSFGWKSKSRNKSQYESRRKIPAVPLSLHSSSKSPSLLHANCQVDGAWQQFKPSKITWLWWRPSKSRSSRNDLMFSLKLWIWMRVPSKPCQFCILIPPDIRGLLPLKPKHLSEIFKVLLHQFWDAEEGFSGSFWGLNLDSPGNMFSAIYATW